MLGLSLKVEVKMTAVLLARCEHKCELCRVKTELNVFELPNSEGYFDNQIMICGVCSDQVNDIEKMDPNHWRCLNDAMWSPVAAVQVMAARLLKRLSFESWAQDLSDILYLDENLQAWVDAEQSQQAPVSMSVDTHGAQLNSGDNVVIIKDLNVKGTRFVAKRGTTVRNITLTNNPEHIEGKVNGTRIIILTCFVKKA